MLMSDDMASLIPVNDAFIFSKVRLFKLEVLDTMRNVEPTHMKNLGNMVSRR